MPTKQRKKSSNPQSKQKKSSSNKPKRPAQSSAKKAPPLARALDWLGFVARSFVLVCLAAFLSNWLYGIYEKQQILTELEGHVSYFETDGVKLQYYCTGSADVSTTAWVISGVGSSWLLNYPPLWNLHTKAPVRVCSYARQGYGFSYGQGNATDVDGTLNRFLALVKHTVPKEHTLHIMGHSYGALIAVQAVHALRESGDRDVASFVNLDGVILPPDFKDEENWESLGRGLQSVCSRLEVASILGVARLAMAFRANPLTHNKTRHIPAQFQRAFRFEASAQHTYQSFAADLLRANLTRIAVAETMKASSSPFFGDLPILVVRAGFFGDSRIFNQQVLDGWTLMQKHCMSTQLSTNTKEIVMQHANHMFDNCDTELEDKLAKFLTTI